MIVLRRNCAAVTVILCLLFLQCAPAHADMDGFESYTTPRKAPAISFQNEFGKTLTLNNFKGKIVLLNIWATWCPPCRAEMPGLDTLQRSFPADKFAVVAIATDQLGKERVQPFFTENSLDNLHMYLNSSMKIMDAFNLQGIPSSYIIDENGMLRGKLEGGADWDTPSAKKLIQSYIDRMKKPAALTTS